MICPNKTSPQFEALLNSGLSEVQATAAFHLNNNDVPSVNKAAELLGVVMAPNGKVSILFKSIQDLESVTSKEQALEIYNKTKSPAFKEWFGSSVVVDDNGEPLMVYHGTGKIFDQFQKADGIFFTDTEDYAKRVTTEKYNKDSIFTMVAFLSLKKPAIIPEEMKDDLPIHSDFITGFRKGEHNKRENYDGVIGVDFMQSEGKTYVVFEPNQIKSIFNEGEFSKEKDNIYQQVKSAFKNQKADTDLNEQITNNFLKEIGAVINTNKQLTHNGKVITGNALTDVVNKTIDLAEGKIAIDTLPEEAAHIYVHWLPSNSMLRRALFDEIENRPIFQKTLNEYKNNPLYQNEDGTVNMDLIKEEAVGKLIAETIVNKSKADKKALSLLQKLINWVKSIFKGKSLKAFEKAAKDIVEGNIKELDQKVKAITKNVEPGKFLLQLDSETEKLINTQLQKANPLQKEVATEVLMPHRNTVLTEDHEYWSTDKVDPVQYTSVTKARDGEKVIPGDHQKSLDWGNDFDKILEGIILGKTFNQILNPENPKKALSGRLQQKDEQGVTMAYKAYLEIQGLKNAWTADGSIILPQIIVTALNEGIPGAKPIAGSIDALLIDPYGNLTIIDLKTSRKSFAPNSEYYVKKYPVGEGSWLPKNLLLSKSDAHALQVMTYAKMLLLAGFPVEKIRTENFFIEYDNDTDGNVTNFKYAGAINKKLSTFANLVDKLVPQKETGKNRLRELNEKYNTNQGYKDYGEMPETEEDIKAKIQIEAELRNHAIKIFHASKDWYKYLENRKHRTLFGPNEESMEKINEFITDIEEMFSSGNFQAIYPKFLMHFTKHLKSILVVLSDEENINKPEYIRTAFVVKDYLDMFRPFLIGTYAHKTKSTELYNKAESLLRTVDTALIGAIEKTAGQIIDDFSSSLDRKNKANIKAALERSNDISDAKTWVDTLGNSGVVILENTAKLLANAREEIRANVEELSKIIKEKGNKLIEVAGTDDPVKLYDFMFQRDKNGKKNGRIISSKGYIYNELYDKYHSELLAEDGSMLQYIENAESDADLKFNIDLHSKKEAFRKFIEAEHIETETIDHVDPYTDEITSEINNITKDGAYHMYTETFKEEREKYMKQDKYGKWIPKDEKNTEFMLWRRKNFEFVRYFKMERNDQGLPTGRVNQVQDWFPKKIHIVSREVAEDGTKLWDATFEKMMYPKTELEKAQSEFYKAYRTTLLNEIKELPSDAMYWFERGFIPTIKGNFFQTLSGKDADTASVATRYFTNYFDVTAMTNQSDVNKTGTIGQTLPILYMNSLQSQERLQKLEKLLEDWALEKTKVSATEWEKRNNELVELRKKELHKMKAEELHPDLTKGLLVFMQMSENYKVMSAVESKLLAVKEQIKRMEFVKKDGKVVEGERSNTYKRFANFLENVFYNDPSFTKDVNTIVINKLMKLTSGISIPFNLFGIVNNKILARINNRIEALGSTVFKHSAYQRAVKEYNTEFLPNYIASIEMPFSKNYYGEKKASSKYEFLTRHFNMVRHGYENISKVNELAFGYKGYEATEWEAQSLVGNAILDTIQMKYTGNNPNLKDCSIKDAFTFDPNTGEGKLIEGYKFLDKDGNIAKDQSIAKNMVTNRIHETNDRIHGNYDAFNKTMLESNLAGKMAMQFHKWVYPNLKQRFESRRYDENIGGGTYIEGRYVTFKTLFKEIAKVKQWSKAWDKLDDYQKANTYKILADLFYIAFFFTIATLAKRLAEGYDDDDVVIKRAINWLRYQSDRGMQEVSIFTPPIGLLTSYQLLKNPFAATNTLGQFAQFVGSVLDYPISSDEERHFQRGNFKGDLKVGKELRDVVPIFKELNRINNLQTVSSFYIQ